MASFNHPDLGSLVGTDHETVTVFKGLTYATLQHPFASPILHETVKEKEVHATSYGPQCVQADGTCDMEHGFIQHILDHEQFTVSGTECLNLNVVVPKTRSGPLPVFVFIHGGGFVLGSNAWPQYNPTALVELSVRERKPVIGININYRLGIAGFLSGEEMRAAGLDANNGLRDQQVAFEWIKKYVHGFGGNADEVTVMGVSAGSVSALLHLESPKPLFRRIVAMGGTPLLLKPIPTEVAEATYQTVVKLLGLETATAEQRVRALVESDPQHLLRNVPPQLPLLPVVDGDLIKSPSTFEKWSFGDVSLPGSKWCSSILIGDCEMDSSILFYMLHDRLGNLNDDFVRVSKDALSPYPGLAQDLQKAYRCEGTQDVNRVLRFANDIGFYAPAIRVASGFPGKSFMYHFNETNPWDGVHKGFSTHLLDAVFLFQYYNEFLSEGQKAVAEKFGRDVVTFINGLDPFPEYVDGKGGAMVYESTSRGTRFVEGVKSEAYGRREHIFRLAEQSSLDVLSSAWDTFLQGGS